MKRIFSVALLTGALFTILPVQASPTYNKEQPLCTWTVKGWLKADHQLSDLNNTYGDVSPLEEVKVKVSAKVKRLGVWGTWGKWDEVTTDRHGYFEVDAEKSCDSKRRFKVEIKFQSDRLEVRHKNATSSTTKVKWYTIHEDSQVERTEHLLNLGDRIFSSHGVADLNDSEVRDHADIWKTYTALLDKFEKYGSGFAFKNTLNVKARHNSDLINDAVERSYVNPFTQVLYLFRSNDGTKDDLKDLETTVLLHEALHAWTFQHSSGEEDLIANAFASGDTHCFESTNVAFIEGFAAFGAEQLRRILFNAEAPLPFNRDALNDGLLCNGKVDRITNMDKMDEHEYGHISALRLLMTDDLYGKTFAGSPTSTDPADPGNHIGPVGGHIPGCPTPPAGFTFKKILSVFLEDAAAGYGHALKKSEMNLEDFIARSAAILDIDDEGAEMLLDLLDPASSVQPNDACQPVIDVDNSATPQHVFRRKGN